MPPRTTRWPSSDSSSQVAAVGGHELAHALRHLAHRVVGEVEPQELLLPAQALADRGLGRGRQRPLEGGRLVAADVEQRGLAADPVALRGLAGGERIVEAQQDLRRVPEAVERADLGQRLQHLAVDQAQVDPGAEVGQRAELAALLAGLDDRLDRALAHVLDRQQAEADRLALDREAEVATGGRPACGPRCPGAGTPRWRPRPSRRCRGTRSARDVM